MEIRKAINNIEVIIANGEGYYTEFKETLSKIDKEIVAFANSSGGKIYLGISDNGIIKGFALTNKNKSEIQSIAENCDPPVSLTLEQVGNIAIINVPEGLRKPYRCANGFYIRNGATSQKMITDDIVSFIRNEGKVLFDEMANSNGNFEREFDEEKYRRFIIKSNISSEYPPKIILENLGLIKNYGEIDLLNNTGILFFGKNPSFQFPHSIITCVLYKGTEKLFILDRKDFNSDLISNIEDAIIFLQKHLNIRYEITSLQRKNILEIPEEALREAIVNSVVHRDYFEKGANIIVEIFDDRLTISNPGGLVKGLNLYELGTKSITRNPLISLIMLRAKYIEKLGTGINRIQTALENAGLPKATFDIDYFFTITMYRHITYNRYEYKSRPMKVSDNSESYYGMDETDLTSSLESSPESSPKSSLENSPTASPTGSPSKICDNNQIIKLSKTPLAIIQLINSNPRITTLEISNILGITNRAIKKNISNLKEKGIIERIGSDRYGYWQVIDSKDN